MPRKRWIKLWTQETLFGTTAKELEPAERAVWYGFLALAGDSPTPGTICVSPEVPYTRTQMCQVLNVKRSLLNRAIDKMFQYGKISINGDGCFTIAQWTHYQGDYVRVQQHRERQQERYEGNGEDDVTNETPIVTEGTDQSRTEEKEEEEQTRIDDVTYGVVDIHERYFGLIGHPSESLQNTFTALGQFPLELIEQGYKEAQRRGPPPRYPAGWVLSWAEAQTEKIRQTADESLDPDKYVKGRYGHVVQR